MSNKEKRLEALISAQAGAPSANDARGFYFEVAHPTAEARSFALQHHRRALGVSFARAMARHMLRRIPFVGLDYDLVRSISDRFRSRERVSISDVPESVSRHQATPELFYAFQAPPARDDGRPQGR